jgi:hypothetical protein
MIARRLQKLEAAIGAMMAAAPCPLCLGRDGRDGMTHCAERARKWHM